MKFRDKKHYLSLKVITFNIMLLNTVFRNVKASLVSERRKMDIENFSVSLAKVLVSL